MRLTKSKKLIQQEHSKSTSDQRWAIW